MSARTTRSSSSSRKPRKRSRSRKLQYISMDGAPRGPVFFRPTGTPRRSTIVGPRPDGEGGMNHPLLRALACLALLAAADGAGAADANLGRDVAANCATCHGTDGKSRGAVPSLAGQDKAYIVQQVKDFRDGKRPSTIMQQLAKGYTDAEIDAAAAHFAAQKTN